MKLAICTLALIVFTSVCEARIVKMEVTAYCTCSDCCGEDATGKTASGKVAKGKMIAAPKKYKFGTRIRIPGYGVGVVEDRGGAIKSAGQKLSKGMRVGKHKIPVRTLPYDRLDVLMETHELAENWGKRIVDVEILE